MKQTQKAIKQCMYGVGNTEKLKSQYLKVKIQEVAKWSCYLGSEE